MFSPAEPQVWIEQASKLHTRSHTQATAWRRLELTVTSLTDPDEIVRAERSEKVVWV